MSDKTPEQQFAEALADFQSCLPTIAKTQTAKVPTKDGKSYSYKYAGLPAVLDATMKALTGHGFAFTATPEVGDHGFVLRYRLLHIGGHSIEGAYPLPSPAQSTPQQIGSAITYARRYCFCAAVGVAADDDDDGQAASDSRSEPLPRAPRRRNATARHNGPEDPTTHVDEWTTRTDTAWTADFRSRLAACPSVPEARGLWAEIAAVQREGRCTTDDAELLHAEVQARVEALQAEGVPV